MKYSLDRSCARCDARLPVESGRSLCRDCLLPIRCRGVVGEDQDGLPIYCDAIVPAVYSRWELCENCYVANCKSCEDSCRTPTAVLAGAVELHRECEAERKREERARQREILANLRLCRSLDESL